MALQNLRKFCVGNGLLPIRHPKITLAYTALLSTGPEGKNMDFNWNQDKQTNKNNHFL